MSSKIVFLLATITIIVMTITHIEFMRLLDTLIDETLEILNNDELPEVGRREFIKESVFNSSFRIKKLILSRTIVLLIFVVLTALIHMVIK